MFIRRAIYKGLRILTLSSSLVAWSEGWGVDFESGWSLHLVPLLLDE